MIGWGGYLIIYSVIEERKNNNLPLIMSLPISPMEYTTAKIMANMLIYFIPWVLLVAGCQSVILGSAEIPNGLMPITMIVLIEILVSFFLLLAVALISESQAWTIGTMVGGNLFFNYFLYAISHISAIEKTMDGPVAVWDETVWWIITAEITVIVFILIVTFLFQARKKDFVC